MKKVFLGGTCNGSTWRDTVTKELEIEYFNPVVENWTPECQKEEIRQRQNSDFVLYVITPKMTGVYSIAEIIDDSNKRPEKTIFCFIKEDEEFEFTPHQVKSLQAIGSMVLENGGTWLFDLEDVVRYLNSQNG